MMGRKIVARGAAAALMMATAVGALEAQTTTAEAERAEAFEARAERMLESADRTGQAAALLRRAADLRDESDPRKLENLVMAYRAYHHAGQIDRASRAAEEAGGLALRRGEVMTAGTALADAAELAAMGGNAERAAQLAEQARLVATSSMLAEAQRRAILDRVSPVT